MFNMDYHLAHWETDDPEVFLLGEYYTLFCTCTQPWQNQGATGLVDYLGEPISKRALCTVCHKPLRFYFIRACSVCKEPAFLLFAHPSKGTGLFKGWACDKCYEAKTGVPCTYGRPNWFKPTPVQPLGDLLAELEDLEFF